MSSIRFVAMPTAVVTALQAGGLDANGQLPERVVSDGDGVPCRHCLQLVAAGEPYLILAHRPFTTLQPYAECGPIFLHAESCRRHEEGAELPEILGSPQYIVRGYNEEERIIYGTGRVTPTVELAEQAAALLARPDVAFVHVRSATNNCFQCRIERESELESRQKAKI
ncbi:MAG: DUF1203 domain-containing protein [Caldilineaceae bacterium]|nr:DUF1203 domain-containing protein [Caldilineaceae bacterium]